MPHRPPQRSARPVRAPHRAALPPLALDSLAFALSIAAEVVAAVIGGRSLNDGLAAVWQAYPELGASQRGAVMDLAYGSLREFGRAEVVLRRLLREPLSEALSDALLRVSLHRLAARPEHAHTTVDQAVEAAARIAGGAFKGLVNGVLRNALRQAESLAQAMDADAEARWQHPRWWIERVKRDWPRDWEAILAAGNAHPPMSLRVNPRRTTRDALAATLAAAGHRSEVLGDYALCLERPAAVASLPGFAEGLFSVQDWGAQQAAAALDVAPGMRVLDACAAPGGKAALILERAQVALTALDSDASRAQRIRATLQRLDLQATVKVGDARNPAAWWDGQAYQRILADVPCSASGVVRRHPDIKWLRRSDDIGKFATQQAEILEALWPLLEVGGRMLYVTCSLFAEENSLQVARFAARHADCKRVALGDTLERTLLPHAHHDGFFLALLEKTA